MLGRLFERLRKRVSSRSRRNEKENIKDEEEWKENPYLFCFRYILEQILAQKKISYRDFSPVLIDEKKDGMLMMEEDIWTVLKQLERDLNALTIITDRGQEFLDYASRMQEETGLMVSVLEKGKTGTKEIQALQGNVMIDFEREGHFCTAEKKAGYCYLPIYKIPWKKGENLDIIVPIGYNTMIVKGVAQQIEKTDSDTIQAEW